MAFLFMDGFDHYGTLIAGDTGVIKWSATVSTAPTGSTVKVRTGTSSIVFSNSSSTMVTKVLPASGGCIVGFAINSSGWGTNDFLQIREGTTVHMAVSSTAGGFLTVKRGGTVLATGTTALFTNVWYYIEFKCVINDTTGSYALKIDAVTEAALTNAGPTDTQNTGTGQWDRVLFGCNANSTYFDDVYICDTSGSAPRNDFLGPIKIETLIPQTDAVAVGSNAGLTPSTGTDHGALVDENPPNTTDYNGSATVGVKDTYNYPSMTLTGTVYGVQTNMYVAKSDTSARTVCPVVRTASTDTDGTAVSPLTTYSYFTQVWQQDPNAGSPIEWTTANIATMQAGMKVVS